MDKEEFFHIGGKEL